eukprot:7091195-Pyramimonas_sp.AAC.1
MVGALQESCKAVGKDHMHVTPWLHEFIMWACAEGKDVAEGAQAVFKSYWLQENALALMATHCRHLRACWFKLRIMLW